MKRFQFDQILKDLEKKMVFITGPRQVGKTYLAKEICKNFKNNLYLNFDDYEDRMIILNKNINLNKDIIVFDELHKMPDWKTYIKGFYDNKPEHLKILVTGSARLHTFKAGGESLAGRFFLHRLLPLSLNELDMNEALTKDSLEKLITRGGFPEPFLSEEETDVNRWRNLYIDGLIREDILDFSRITEIKKIQLLLEMLTYRVGSPLSLNSIAQDLKISPTTVSKYVDILEALFIIFKIHPFSKNIVRSILKEPKIYFFDNGLVNGDEGKKFENFMALSLLKHIYFMNDVKGEKLNLNYLRTKDGKEVDFCVTNNNEIIKIIEAKNSKSVLSKNLLYFIEKYNLKGIQVIKNLDKDKMINNDLDELSAYNFLLNIDQILKN